MKHRITPNELRVGQPLAWDAFSRDGVLLLRRGQTVPSQTAVDRLLDEGLFQEAEEPAGRTSQAPEEKPSALQYLIDAQRSLALICEQKPENVDDFSGRMDSLVQSVLDACGTHAGVCLSSILLLHDKPYSIKHPIDVAIVANLLARQLSLDAAAQAAIAAAAVSMNIGMYEVHDKLNAFPGPLNEKLLAMVKAHPTASSERLAKLGIRNEEWLTLVRQHHEHNDGSGYPAGLSGDAIHIGAKLIGAADKYCAMVSGRSYRTALKPTVALRELYIKHGAKIDVMVAGAMIRLIGIYPIGTIVRLKSSEIGVVVGPGEGPDTPAVHAVIGRSGSVLDVASYRKTHLKDFGVEDVLTLEKLSVPIRMTTVWAKDARLRS